MFNVKKATAIASTITIISMLSISAFANDSADTNISASVKCIPATEISLPDGTVFMEKVVLPDGANLGFEMTDSIPVIAITDISDLPNVVSMEKINVIGDSGFDFEATESILATELQQAIEIE